MFVASIPQAVGCLARLQTFAFSGNRLRGVIPDAADSLLEMRQLLAHQNSLKGAILSAMRDPHMKHIASDRQKCVGLEPNPLHVGAPGQQRPLLLGAS